MVKKIPNILSISRIVMAPIFVMMYVREEEFWSALSIAVFAVAAVTDFFDGYIARNYGAKTPTGNFLDPLADKFLTTAGFLSLWYILPDQFPMWAIALIIIRDIGTTIIRLNSNGKPTLNVATSNLAKWKTAIQMVYLYAALIVGAFASSTIRLGETARNLLHSDVFYWGLLLLTALTVYTGVEYVVGKKKEEV